MAKKIATTLTASTIASMTGATNKGKVTAAATLRYLRTQYDALTKPTPSQAKAFDAAIAAAEQAVYDHRVRRTLRPAKVGRTATTLGLRTLQPAE